MSEIIEKVLKTQDVNNRRVFAGDPNGNVYGAAGSTCQDTVSGVLYVATRAGMNAWEPLATVSGTVQSSAMFAQNPNGLMIPGDWSLTWSPTRPDDAIWKLSDSNGVGVFYVSNPDNLIEVQCGTGDPFTVSVQPLRNLEKLKLNISALSSAPVIDNMMRLIEFDISSTYVTDWPTITNLPKLERLDVGDCSQLVGSVNWPAGSIPLLDEVTIKDATAMTSSDIDSVFISVERASLANNGLIDAISISPPTAASLAARNALIARGWTIIL